MLSKKRRSRGRLISFHYGQTTNDMILNMEKLSTQLVYLLHQGCNGFWSTATRRFSLYLCLSVRILKGVNLRVNKVFCSLCVVLFGLSQGGGILLLRDEMKIPIEIIHVKETNNYICRV